MKRLGFLLVLLFSRGLALPVDLSITATSVLASSAAKPHDFVAAETITAGAVVYKATSSTVGLATATNATKSVAFGIALNGGAVGQPIRIASEDTDFTIGATMTTGLVLVVSNVPGKIAPSADLAATWYPVVIGVANTATKATIKIVRGTTAIPSP